MNGFGFPQTSETTIEGVDGGGLWNRDQCRQLARKIIEAYDANGDGVCDSIDVAKWLCECYRAMNKNFKPTATDIASYVQVVDRNRRGKISFEDLEAFIVKYFLVGNRG